MTSILINELLLSHLIQILPATKTQIQYVIRMDRLYSVCHSQHTIRLTDNKVGRQSTRQTVTNMFITQTKLQQICSDVGPRVIYSNNMCMFSKYLPTPLSISQSLVICYRCSTIIECMQNRLIMHDYQACKIMSKGTIRRVFLLIKTL